TITPEPALWNCRSRGARSGASKKRRKNGSSSSGLRRDSRSVPRVAIFTTAGEAFFTTGASEGTGASPTFSGNCALAPPLNSTALAARTTTLIACFLMHISCRETVRILAATVRSSRRGEVLQRTTCEQASGHRVHNLCDCGGNKMLCVVLQTQIFG